MNRKVDIRIEFSPIKDVTVFTSLQEERSLITLNIGEDIIGQILNMKTVDLGFILVRETISQQMTQINPRYIRTIGKVNVTKLDFEHNNKHFPSGRRTVWYSHRTETELIFHDKGQHSSVYECEKFVFLGLKELLVDDHI